VRLWIVAIVMALVVAPFSGRAPSVSSAAGAVASAGAGDAFGVDLPPAPTQGPAAGSPAALPDGTSWGRAAADWALIEPARGKFAWADLDAQVRRATAGHFHLVLLLEHTPQWAALEPTAPQPVWEHQPPKDLADWAAFVRAVARRYEGRVAAWQVESSRDLAEFRGTTLDYQAMLHVVRQESQRVDSRALVVAASPSGLDLPYTKEMLARAGTDFDAIMLYPRGRRPEELLEALGAIRTRLLTDGRHQLWLDGASSADPVQIAASALAGGVVREFWPALDPGLDTAAQLLGGARFVGALNRGPEVAVLVFERGADALVVAWTGAGTQPVPIATTGPAEITGSTGQAIAASGSAGTVTVGPDPVFVTNPDPSLVQDAAGAAAQGPPLIPVAPGRDFSKAPDVSAQLGAVNVERGLYNQRFRTVPSGAVFPVTVEGTDAIRTDPNTDAVYVYFDVDGTFAYFDDGRYDILVTIQVHRASTAQRVGFNLLYDSMSGYRFTPWVWVDAGDGWATYTVRLTDAAFAHTWGWDFAVNAGGDRREPLVVRSVAVTRLAPGARTP